MNESVRVPQPTFVLHGGGVSLACGQDGQLLAEELHGLFAGDTRVLSTYRFQIAGQAWQQLGRSRSGHGTARWQFQNPELRGPDGDIAAGTLLLSLRRRLDGALHDDLQVCAYADWPLRVRLTLQLDADFADIFEVKARSLAPRLSVGRVPTRAGVTLSYERGAFTRALTISFKPSGPPPTIVGALVVFELELEPGATWTCCLEAVPTVDGETLAFSGDPHESEPSPVPDDQLVEIRADPILARPFAQGRDDLHALAVFQPAAPPYLAAGVPWFLTLFGRDSLMAGLMAGLVGSWPLEGALAAVGPLQATERDDFRDAEPGKLLHEIRRGELAQRGIIPHSPYFGAHDVPALYCLALWQAWHWTGNRRLLDAHLGTARLAMGWCDALGDRDSDGLQEYATRSSQGYYNQSWKDSGEAIVHADGRLAELPLATVELQGYLFAARLAMAELLTEAGDPQEAARMRAAARELRSVVEERFWSDDQRFYASALDRDKRPVTAILSNPGHLLWCGLPRPERAAAVAARFLEPDMSSGWGLRTLSSKNPAYNPLAYQLGAVWPHDTALAAAGLWRYGLREEASQLLLPLLEAAAAFELERLPELFCGLDRSYDLPVPYTEANSPQAWAAAVPLLATHLFLGLVPDAPAGRCFLSPWLPEWLPSLELTGITIGGAHLDVLVVRRGTETVIERAEGHGIKIVRGGVEAPLWGAPSDT